MTQPEGNYVNYTYDARGNVTETRSVAKSGSGLSDIVSTASFPSTCSNQLTCNQPITTTDPRSNTTDYTYNATHGGVLTVTDPAATSGATRPQTRYDYSSVGSVYRVTGVSSCQTGAAPSCVGTAAEVKTAVGYDGSGNIVSIARGAGDASLTATTTASYTALGDVATVDGPLAGTADTTTFRYDAARRRVGAISADPDGAGSLKRRAQKVTYDTAGRPTVTEVGTVNGTSDSDWALFASAQAVTTSYVNSRKTKEVLSAGTTTYQVSQISYDADGRSLCNALRMDPGTWSSLPSSACVLATSSSSPAQDRISATTYDAVGRVTKTQSAYGTVDQSNDATGTYSNNGVLTTLLDANTNATTYEYDGFDRLSKTRYPSTTTGSGASSTTDYEQLVYDASSNVTSRRLRGYSSDGSQHIDYGYDALNRLTYKDLPGSEPDVAYVYDNLGRLTTAVDSASNFTGFAYDALGRPTAQSSPLGVVGMGYDLASRRTLTVWPDSFYVTYAYDTTGDMTTITEQSAVSKVVATYAYDDLGRRISLTRGNGTTTTYTPDAVSRLSSLIQNLSGTTNDLTLGFAYNPASQIKSITRSNDSYAWGGAANRNDASSVNGLNQVTTVGAGSLGYDARGNLNSTGSASYTYSSENLLLTGPSSAALTYDPLLRLYQESGAGIATTRFLYDGQAMIGEYDSTGTLQKRYVHGPGSDEPLVEYDRSGSTFVRAWHHADERGSVIAESNESGVSTVTNAYDENGMPGSGNAGRFGFTGQAWLPSVGLWYYKARMYAPSLGRFMQTDPIGYDDGLNWYGYVGGDPVNRSDPSGLCDAGQVRVTLPHRNQYGVNDGPNVVVTAPPGICVNLAYLQNDLGGPIVYVGGGGPTAPVPPAPQNELPICEAPAFGAHIQIGFDMAIFLGGGGGLSGGLDIDPDTGLVTAFASSRSGLGIGLIAGLGITFTDSGPTAGHSYDNKNAQLGLGAVGGGISKSGNQPATGSIGLSLGPKAGFELSRTNNFTRAQELGGKYTPLCKFPK